MRLYLVRHAESKFNAGRIHQLPSSPLSRRGLEQAQVLARRLSDLPADTLLSSPYTRALQTAEPVARALGLPVMVTPLVAELKRPSAVQGRSYDDPEVIAIKEAVARGYTTPGWRHSDEETFGDAQARGLAFLHNMQILDSDTVVTITHGGFLTFLVALMLLGETPRPHDVVRWQSSTHVHNTGITRCDYDPRKDLWTLVTWNDCAHLSLVD